MPNQFPCGYVDVQVSRSMWTSWCSNVTCLYRPGRGGGGRARERAAECAGEADEVLGENEGLQSSTQRVGGPIRSQRAHHSAISIDSTLRVFAAACETSSTNAAWSNGDKLAAACDDCAGTSLPEAGDFDVMYDVDSEHNRHLYVCQGLGE